MMGGLPRAEPGNEPVFIVGPTRSGTTLLRALLDKHPRFAGLDELYFCTDLVRSFAQVCGSENRSLLDAMQVPAHEELRQRFVALHRFPRDAIATARGKTRWIDNTHTTNDWYIDVIDELYDGDCRYLLMVRHPADVLVSQLERWGGDIDERATQIVKVMNVQREITEQIAERAHTVRYEDLVADPVGAIAAVCRFLDEPELPELAPESLDLAHPIILGDDKIRTSGGVHARSIGRWRTLLAAEQLALLRRHDSFASATRAFGYDLSTADISA